MSGDDFGTPDPSDIDAERWCLGGMMRNRGAMTEVVELLEPDDFYRPAHQMIYTAMVSLWAQGIECDPVAVRDELERRSEISKCGGPPYVLDLYSTTVALISSATVHHAEIIRDLAARRKVALAARRLLQRAMSRDQDVAAMAIDAQHEVANAVMAASQLRSRQGDLVDVDAFIGRAMGDRLGVVIDGLLDAQDRALFVALEGDGKSTVLRQIAVGKAAGVHPFTLTKITPGKALIVDLENPRPLLRREISKMTDYAELHPGWSPRNLQVVSRPEGCDLTKPSDAMWLADIIRTSAPELICAGPIYQMMEDERELGQHIAVKQFWDKIRGRYGSALVLETHPPIAKEHGHRDLRPFGWGGWSRWPEFGLTLERDKKAGDWVLGRFRGDRERGRCWPERLDHARHGVSFPWAASYPPDTFQGELGA